MTVPLQTRQEAANSETALPAAKVDHALEEELLCWCARTRREPRGIQRIEEILDERLDWGYLMDAVAWHGIVPLFFWHLNQASSCKVPPAVLENLKWGFQENTRHSLRLTRELLKLVQLLEGNGISALPFKGPTLALTAYGNLSLRQFSDLDLLVHEDNALRSKDLLLAEGYRLRIPLNDKEERKQLQRGHAYSLISGDETVHVDLHWRTAPKFFSFPVDLVRVWPRLERIQLGDREVLTLCREDLLLLLCAHGARHEWKWKPLGSLCDVAELIGSSEHLDWKMVFQESVSQGRYRAFLLAVLLAKDLLGVSLPVDVTKKLEQEPRIQKVAEEVRQSFFRPGEVIPGFYLRMSERLRDRLLLSIEFTKRKMIRVDPKRTVGALPRCLSFLDYLFLPFRLLRNNSLASYRSLLKRLLDF